MSTTTELVPRSQELTTYIHDLSDHKDLDQETFDLNKELGTAFAQKAEPCAKGYSYIDLEKISAVFQEEAKPFLDFRRDFINARYIDRLTDRGVHFHSDLPVKLDLPDGFHTTNAMALTQREVKTVTNSKGKEIAVFQNADGEIVPYEPSVRDASFAVYTMPREGVIQEVGIKEQTLQSFDNAIPAEQAKAIIQARNEFSDIRIWDAYQGPEIDLNDQIADIQLRHERNLKESKKLSRRVRIATANAIEASQPARNRMKNKAKEAKNAFSEFATSSFSLVDPLAVGIKHIDGQDHYYFICGWE